MVGIADEHQAKAVLTKASYEFLTELAEETDPNNLHDLNADLDAYQVYTIAQIDELVALYLGGADRDNLDPILDACVAATECQGAATGRYATFCVIARSKIYY